VGHQKDFFHEGKEVKVAHPLLDQVGVTADAGDQDGYLVMGASHPSTPMRHPTCMVQVHIVRVLLFAYPCCLLCAHPNTLVVFLPPPPRIPALQVCLLQEAHRAGLLADTQVEGWHFEQHEGEVVFIPAGCPHQVRNLRACTKVGGVCVCVCGGALLQLVKRAAQGQVHRRFVTCVLDGGGRQAPHPQTFAIRPPAAACSLLCEASNQVCVPYTSARQVLAAARHASLATC
jgi:hypothetical protein